MLAQWKSTFLLSRRLVVRFHRALTSIWNDGNQFLVTETLLTITNEIWWHFSTLTKIWNGDGQWMPPYIRINSDDPQRSVTVNHCWYEMVTVVVYHYSHYSWQTLNVTTTPILPTMRILVTVNERHHIYARIVTPMKNPSQ